MAKTRRRKAEGTTVLVRVKRALFTSPERWSTALGYSRPFRRLAEDLITAETPISRVTYVPGLPVRRPLPFGRFDGLYRLKAQGVEGDALVLYVA